MVTFRKKAIAIENLAEVQDLAVNIADVPNKESKYYAPFLKLTEEVLAERAQFEKEGIRFIFARVLNNDGEIKKLQYGKGSFELIVVGNFERYFPVVVCISDSMAFYYFSVGALILPITEIWNEVILTFSTS